MGVDVNSNSGVSTKEGLDFAIYNSDVLFFSRGRGLGHAIPDMAILEELRRFSPRLRISVCTYGTGYKAFRDRGQTAFDLKLTDDCNVWEVAQAVGRILRQTQASLVVSHEEFAAIPAAKIFEIPSVFVTHWLAPQNSFLMQAIADVDHVLFLEEQGHFLTPDYLQGKIHYVGPVLRRFCCVPDDRRRLRIECGAPPEETIIVLFPGTGSGWQEPIFNLILEAFDALPRKRKRLIWVAGEDFDRISLLCSRHNGITVLQSVLCPEHLMAASDLAITAGTYNVGKELGALGVPSISLSVGKNPIDDYFARCLPHNTFLYAQDTDSTALTGCIEEALTRGLFTPDPSAMDGSGAAKAARYLFELIQFHERLQTPNIHSNDALLTAPQDSLKTRLSA